ncbi:hypothetical protein PGT21_004259 [Puccinia graminis f. sp. tritici]|uniref:Uncharacterized protein n=1 Tax=Puccinia graminis f. sp. tritici TaxID=56615 RepID=A0A5B0NRS4_PUCGR|nr:hypothetical protein PGT21_004259 [Puccinia graminis f. sp. tritici]
MLLRASPPPVAIGVAKFPTQPPISPAVPRCYTAFHLTRNQQLLKLIDIYQQWKTAPQQPLIPSFLKTATDTVLSESILSELIFRRQQRLASSTIQRSLLLEAAEVLADDTINYADYFPPHGGSKPGKKPNLPCEFESSYNQLYNHYFSDTPPLR